MLTSKSVQLVGVGFLLFVTAALFSLFLVSSLQNDQGPAGPLDYILSSMLLAGFADLGVWLWRQLSRVSEKKSEPPAQTFGARHAWVVSVRNSITVIFGMVVTIAIVVALIAAGVVHSQSGYSLQPAFWQLVLGVVLYILVGRPIGAHLYRIVRSVALYVSYSLDADGIRLLVPSMGAGGEPRTVHIEFSELSEIRVLSYYEAETLKQNIGPDISLWLREAQGAWQLAQRTHERPRALDFVGAGKPALLLRGKELFYLISVQSEMPHEVVAAFERYKKQQTRSH